MKNSVREQFDVKVDQPNGKGTNAAGETVPLLTFVDEVVTSVQSSSLRIPKFIVVSSSEKEAKDMALAAAAILASRFCVSGIFDSFPLAFGKRFEWFELGAGKHVVDFLSTLTPVSVGEDLAEPIGIAIHNRPQRSKRKPLMLTYGDDDEGDELKDASPSFLSPQPTSRSSVRPSSSKQTPLSSNKRRKHTTTSSTPSSATQKRTRSLNEEASTRSSATRKRTPTLAAEKVVGRVHTPKPKRDPPLILPADTMQQFMSAMAPPPT